MKDNSKQSRSVTAGKLTKLSDILCTDPRIQSASDDDDINIDAPYSSEPAISEGSGSGPGSPYCYTMSPPNPSISPYTKSPWMHSSAAVSPLPAAERSSALLATLVREEGHVYSLAASGDLLYTGSESKNIRVWKRWREFSGFKSSSGFVKAIVIAADGKIFTGHQDGKIRVWRVSPTDPAAHRRIGTLPRMKDFLKSSINPYSYVEARRHRSAVWLRHFDAVSCLSLDAEHGILYSGSWDKTVKAWRISDSKCLESINAHDDAVNSVAAAGGGLVYTGSADGTVKVWRREWVGRRVQHAAVKTLLEQESAVTALAVAVAAGGDALYCGSSDGMVNYWWGGGETMVHGGALRGHRMAVLCLAAAGRLVVSGSADKTLCVWRRDSGGGHTKISVLAGHGGPIKCLAVEEDRQSAADGGDDAFIVYSGSLDRSVKIWRVTDRRDGGNSHVPSPLEGSSPVHVRGAPLGASLRLGHVAASRASVS